MSASRVEVIVVSPESREGASPAAAGATCRRPHQQTITRAVQKRRVRGNILIEVLLDWSPTSNRCPTVAKDDPQRNHHGGGAAPRFPRSTLVVTRTTSARVG